ncbi:MAG: nucleoside triphosphate pyrophosphohydrolase [Bacteroidia bacterium]
MTREEKLAQFDRLLTIMDELRAQCPWDREQTWESIRHLTLEETAELSDAILDGDPDEVKKELGDILLHIVFYSKIGDEQQHFDIGDVIDSLCAKLIRRHPHIYGEVKADDAETVKQNWEKIKLAEKGRNEKRSVLDGVPRSLASLVKAYRMQEKVAQVGFDWKSVDGAIDKVQEEWQELRDAATSKEKEEEFGDLLFALVNYARFSGINPDDALENTNRKFIRRFRYIEDRAAETDRKMGDFSLEELDAWWNEAKANGL